MLKRERSAWVFLTALVVCMGSYFVAVVVMQNSHTQPSFFARIGILAVATSTMAVVVAIDRLLAWLGSRGREPEAVDERDRLIEYRSATIAYYVLIAGMILVGCIMPLDPTKSGWDIVNAALFYLVLAEIVHHGLVVLGYRRGSHV